VDEERNKNKELEKSGRGPEKGAIQEVFMGEDKNRSYSESGDDLSSGSTDNLQVREVSNVMKAISTATLTELTEFDSMDRDFLPEPANPVGYTFEYSFAYSALYEYNVY